MMDDFPEDMEDVDQILGYACYRALNPVVEDFGVQIVLAVLAEGTRIVGEKRGDEAMLRMSHEIYTAMLRYEQAYVDAESSKEVE